MLSYEDCVELSGLTPDVIAAIARHEHLPEIVAVEMGACLCETLQGKNLILRMIIEDSEQACQRGDTETAVRLGLTLHDFIDANMDRQEALAPGSRTLALAPVSVHKRLEAHLPEMLRRFGLDRDSAEEHFRPELQIAEVCCAACTQTARCGDFLLGLAGRKTSPDFCPNAPLFQKLGRRVRSPAGASEPRHTAA